MPPERQVPLAFVAVNPASPDEVLVPVFGRLFVGRSCTGIEPDFRLLVDDSAASRDHLEIRLDPDSDRAHLIDTSTNGTRLNGSRVTRGHPVALRPGDLLSIGETVLEFRSEVFAGTGTPAPRRTTRRVDLTEFAMVVGDVIGYSTTSQHTDDKVLLQSIDRLYGDLGEALAAHNGTLNNYVGDAFFALWELDAQADAPRRSIDFALEATDRVRRLAPQLPLRDLAGEPIRMGWGVVMGRAAVGTLGGMFVSVLGDATNLAFRLSERAGRDGRPEILATERVAESVGDDFEFGQPEEIEVKGRSGAETVLGVQRRRAL